MGQMQAQAYEPLDDDELLAASDDPELSKLLNSADRRRLQRLRPPKMEASVNVGDRTFKAGSFDNQDAVTLGQFVDDPIGSAQKIGAILKKDITDPRLLAQAALAYFGPKAIGIVGQVASSPAVRAGFKAAVPAMTKAAVGYRVGQAVEGVRAGVNAAKAASSAPSAAPAEPVPSPAPPAETPASVAPTPPPTQRGQAAASSQSAASGPVSGAASASGKLQLSSEEMLQAQQWAKQGLTPQQILDRIASAREFNEKFGLKMPTPAEKRFPKGMRGRPHSAPEPDE